jgi:hypothetical protein
VVFGERALMSEECRTLVTAAAVNGFAAAYLFFAWSWDLPADLPLKRLMNRSRGFVRWTGLWHTWALFAPDPVREDRLVAADVYLETGEVLRWDQPRFDRLGLWAGLRAARERKFLAVLTEENTGFKFLRPAFADFLARTHTGPGRAPVRVVLKVLVRPVGPPGTAERPGWAERVLYTYTVPPVAR